MTSARLLIVTADDYGLTDAVSGGILRAHRDGIVTSTSVLAVGSAVRRTAGRLADHPSLAVGAHLALVGEDPPVLSAREVPTLVDRSGRFPLTWSAFLARAAAGRVDPADVRREFDAQMQLLTRDLGLAPGHLDTHQHLHLWPAVAAVVVDVARTWRVAAVRQPTSRARGPKGTGIRLLAARLGARLRAAGLAAPTDYEGLDQAGGLTLPRFLAALDRLAATGADGVEINCHPGEADPVGAGRHAWSFAWEAELAALTSPRLRVAVLAHGFRLGGPADLARPSRGVTRSCASPSLRPWDRISAEAAQRFRMPPLSRFRSPRDP